MHAWNIASLFPIGELSIIVIDKVLVRHSKVTCHSTRRFASPTGQTQYKCFGYFVIIQGNLAIRQEHSWKPFVKQINWHVYVQASEYLDCLKVYKARMQYTFGKVISRITRQSQVLWTFTAVQVSRICIENHPHCKYGRFHAALCYMVLKKSKYICRVHISVKKPFASSKAFVDLNSFLQVFSFHAANVVCGYFSNLLQSNHCSICSVLSNWGLIKSYST